MANKKGISRESLTGASTQEVQGIIVDCDRILNDASNQGDESKEMHYIYLVRCVDDSLYCGWTTDLKCRIDAHNGHISGGAKYTRGRRPVTLVYAESFHQKQETDILTKTDVRFLIHKPFMYFQKLFKKKWR